MYARIYGACDIHLASRILFRSRYHAHHTTSPVRLLHSRPCVAFWLDLRYIMRAIRCVWHPPVTRNHLFRSTISYFFGLPPQPTSFLPYSLHHQLPSCFQMFPWFSQPLPSVSPPVPSLRSVTSFHPSFTSCSSPAPFLLVLIYNFAHLSSFRLLTCAKLLLSMSHALLWCHYWTSQGRFLSCVPFWLALCDKVMRFHFIHRTTFVVLRFVWHKSVCMCPLVSSSRCHFSYRLPLWDRRHWLPISLRHFMTSVCRDPHGLH